mgnify:CR=1 FL=1
MSLKASLDPESRLLVSWTGSGDPCGGSFVGVACNRRGQVANISLQGKGLSGKLSPAVAELRHLTGLYLHYNALYGEIPREISTLSELTDLYLNVNNLSGEIPPELGNMGSLQGVDFSPSVLLRNCVFVLSFVRFSSHSLLCKMLILYSFSFLSLCAGRGRGRSSE